MTKLLIMLISIAMVSIASANPVKFAWDDPNPAGTVVSYNVYVGGSVVATSTTTSAEVDLSAGSNYSAYVTAVGPEGLESGPSNTVGFYVLEIMMNLRLN